MNTRIIRHAILAMAAALAAAMLASPAQAQDTLPDPQFAALARQLRTDDSVRITLSSGEVVKGHLAELAPGQLTVLVGEEQRAVPTIRVERVQRTRMGVTLGALIGAGTGFATGAVLSRLFENGGEYPLQAALGLAGIGAGAGIGIDALVNLPRTVYRRTAVPTISAGPILGPGARGAAVRMSF
jgi:hypothetical protein